jgi:hypothetical protein
MAPGERRPLQRLFSNPHAATLANRGIHIAEDFASTHAWQRNWIFSAIRGAFCGTQTKPDTEVLQVSWLPVKKPSDVL